MHEMHFLNPKIEDFGGYLLDMEFKQNFQILSKLQGGMKNGIASMRCLFKKWNVMSRV